MTVQNIYHCWEMYLENRTRSTSPWGSANGNWTHRTTPSSLLHFYASRASFCRAGSRLPCRAVPCRAVPDHSFPRQDRLSLTCRLSVPGSSIGSISECIAAAEPNSSSDQVGGSVHRHPCARSRMGMGRVICLCFLRQPTCSEDMLAQVGDQWQDIFCREDLSRLWRFTRRSRRSKDSCSTYSPRSAASSCRSAWITSTTFTIVDLDRGLVS